MSQEQIAELERLQKLASDFLGGQHSATVSVDLLTDLLILVSLRSAQDTIERIAQDMISATINVTPRAVPNLGRRGVV